MPSAALMRLICSNWSTKSFLRHCSRGVDTFVAPFERLRMLDLAFRQEEEENKAKSAGDAVVRNVWRLQIGIERIKVC